MSTSLTLPTYACSCLNVKIFPKRAEEIDDAGKRQSQASNDMPPKAPPGWETVCIDKGSVVIVYDHLMSKIRSEGGLQFVCRLCDTLVYRQVGGSDSISSMHSNPTLNSNTTTLATAQTGGLVSTARDRPDFENLFRQDKKAWIQVCIGSRGCISGKQLETTLQAIPSVFGLVIPANSDTLTPSPTPPTHTVPLPPASSTMPPPISALSNSLLATNSSSNQQSQLPKQPLLTLPQLFPPPPITPSHQLFTNLARDAKKASDAAREAAEAEIAKFIEAKRREVLEYEARLKKQVYTVWKAWKDSSQSEQLPSPSTTSTVDSVSGVTDSRPTITKKHTSSHSTSSDASSKTRTVIRTFEEEPTSPRPVQRPINNRTSVSSPNHAPYSSSLSPSNATPRVRPTMSALGTSLRQSGMHYPQRQPSPPPVGVDEENFDMEFDDMIPGRERLPEKQDDTESPPPQPDNAPTRHQKPKASALKRVSMDASKPKTITLGSSSDLSTEGSVNAEGQTGRRKAVKFSSDQPDVVTVTREIESEKLQRLQEEQARGEEAIFDLDDGDEEDGSKRTQDQHFKSSPDIKEERITPLQSIPPAEQGAESPRTKFSFPRLSQVGNEKSRNIEYTMAKSLPTTSMLSNMANRSAGGVGSLGLDVDSRMDQTALTSRARSGKQTQNRGSVSPYGGELSKIMASKTPTHRSPWLEGRSTGRKMTQDSSSDEEDEDEGDDDDDTEGSDDGDNQVKNDFVPSSSVPLPIPRMSKVVESKSQAAVAADNDFEGAMSKSVDPGPALELLSLDKGGSSRRGRPTEDEDEDEDEDEELGDERRRKRSRDEEEAANEEEARDLMNRLIEGRGSLYAQRILSQTDRGIPASMWRSMA